MSTWNVEQLKHVADILMAAAHADGDVGSVEGSTVREIVAGLAGGASLPKAIEDHIKGFKLGAFDLASASAALKITDGEHRRELLQLVSRVTESDDVHDLDESDYIVKVARAIGASPEDYAGLTVDLVDISQPPPLPTK